MNIRNSTRGFALSELLVVVAIIAIALVVTIPAFTQLMPQYRMRSTASEIAATLRLARADAIATRRPWRVSFNGATEAYALSRLSSPTASVTGPGNWEKIGNDNRPIPAASNRVWWKTLRASSMDLQTSTANSFYDVDCANGVDVIFTRDGTIDTTFNTACSAGGTSRLSFTTKPTIRLSFNSSRLVYNRYDIEVESSGLVRVLPKKE